MTRQSVLTVLTVCSGNIARSPLMALLLADRLGPAVEVSSAGTIAIAGEPMTDEAQAVARRLGVDGSHHRSRPLSNDLIAGADLVLVATREHRADVARLEPIASRRTFTLREFARLAPTVDAETLDGLAPGAERGPELVRAVAARRGIVVPLTQPSDDDLDDPFRQAESVYDRVGSEIDKAVATLVAMMAPADGARAQ